MRLIFASTIQEEALGPPSRRSNHPMRIVYLSQYFPPEIGAPAARVFELSREWVKLGHQVAVVTGFPNHPTGVVPEAYRGKLVDHEIIEGIDVYRNWTLAVPNRSLAMRVASQLSFPLSVVGLGLPRVAQPDVVIATSPSIFTSISGLVFARALHVPFVFEVRDLWPQLFIEMGMVKNARLIRALEAAEMYQYRRAQKVVVVTESFKSILTARGVPAEKLAVIPNGVDLRLFHEDPEGAARVRVEQGLGDRFVLAYIGTHGLLHGLKSVLSAADRLRGNDDIRFLFVGHGHDREALMAQAREMRLPNVVFVSGQPREAIPAFISAADACLVALRRDPFLAENFVPSKIFEFFGCGRPVVASVAGEAADIVERSGAGVVVAPEDPDALAAAVIALARDRVATKAMGARGLSFARLNYDRTELALRYLEVLGNVSARARLAA
jgi:colanic acid biosynthesis glycosyl transferase WcaI